MGVLAEDAIVGADGLVGKELIEAEGLDLQARFLVVQNVGEVGKLGNLPRQLHECASSLLH